MSREEQIGGLHALVAFLGQHEDVPFPIHVGYGLQTDDDETGIAEVARVAAVLGVEPTVNRDRTMHFASRDFGPVTYQISYITRQDWADWGEMQRLGKEALAARRAEPSPEREESARVEEDAAELDSHRRKADVEAYEAELRDALVAAGVDHDIWHDEDGDEGWHITIEAGDEQTLSGGGRQRETVLGWWTRDDTWYWTFVDQHGEPYTVPARELNDGAGPDVVAEFVRYHSGQEDPASPAPAGGAS